MSSEETTTTTYTSTDEVTSSTTTTDNNGQQETISTTTTTQDNNGDVQSTTTLSKEMAEAAEGDSQDISMKSELVEKQVNIVKTVTENGSEKIEEVQTECKKVVENANVKVVTQNK